MLKGGAMGSDVKNEQQRYVPQRKIYRRGTSLTMFSLVLLMLAMSTLFLNRSVALAQGETATNGENADPLRITKVANVDHIEIGETIIYSITVENNGTGAVDGLRMEDELPEGLSYVPDSASTDVGQVDFNPQFNQIGWSGALQVQSKATIVFQARVQRDHEKNLCERELRNSATLVMDGVREFFTPETIVKIVCPDLGDAPDDTNHPGMTMLAYSGVPAKFPTVFDPNTGTPSGPLHRHPRADAWLGNQVSGEIDADLLPDMDGITNIKPAIDEADFDHEDDGVVHKPMLNHCEPAEMSVMINVVGTARDRYVNVWFDWNRDGDWDDDFDCPGTTTSEWAVRNSATTLGPGQHVITLPVFLPYNPDPNLGLWARVSLAEMPAPFMPDSQMADGRGPAEGYRYGETEDYFIRTDIPDYRDLEIKKIASVTTTVPGGLIEYMISIHNTGNLTAANVQLIDPIPMGTSYVSSSATATLPLVAYDTSNNQIEWSGDIPPNGNVDIAFKVEVSDNVECSKAIVNRAAILAASTSPVKTAEAEVRVRCPGEAALAIEKYADVTTTVPGGMIEYTVEIHNDGDATASDITMLDLIPAGTMFISGTLNASEPTAVYEVDNNKIVWNGNIDAGKTIIVKFKVEVMENALCAKPIRNRASLLMPNRNDGFFAETDVYVKCAEERELHLKKQVDVATTTAGSLLNYTLIVENHASAPAIGVNVVDPIPAGTTYVNNSLTATAPTESYDATDLKVLWTGDIPANGNVVIKFQVKVDDNVECESYIHNRAVLFADQENIELAAKAETKVLCPNHEDKMDFGDAPDSLSNHHDKDNTAYSGVLGRFPTVWENTPTSEGSGPAHHLDRFWLGKEVTAEKDADLAPDEDGVTNILNDGANDVANQDEGDEGWLNRTVPIEDCRETMFHMRVSRSSLPLETERLYLNVWFDGNRDGDWDDVGDCPSTDNLNRGRSFEWIVQNYKIDATAIPASGYRDYRVPSVLIHNLKPEARAWMRFTLSEKPAIHPTTVDRTLTALPDGRGPAYPAAFRLGETEDYLRPGDDSTGQPGKIGIDKTVETNGEPIGVGDSVTYTVYLNHNGGTAAASTVMTDMLPAEVTLAGRIQVVETNPSATPLFAGFNPSVGPSGMVSWRGRLSPDASIKIIIPVRIKVCPHTDTTVDATGEIEGIEAEILNVAEARQTDGSTIRADKELKIVCSPTVEPGLKLVKAIRLSRETDDTGDNRSALEESNEGGFLSGEKPIYVLRLESDDNLTHEVAISDTVPTGLVVTGVKSNVGQARILNQGSTIRWKGEVGPNQPVEIKLEVRPTTRIVCGERMINIAYWWSGQYRGESNPVTLFLVCRDLGDAPDSTNHAGVAMDAYSGVQANFPTVYNVAAPERGPMHKHAQPFHLGNGVTSEFEADQSFDADGVHNIEPKFNRPNLDRRDDGLRLDSVNLRHCEFNTMKVAVSIDNSALSLLAANDGQGYLNVWVDSNRDGDWADSFDCDRPDENKIALEHIVIDLPINAAILGAGLHELLVDTTVPVHYPTEGEVAGMPAWLRVTLSEKPSNKTLTTGTIQHGDGRGHDTPFRLGETEDYLLRAPGQTGEADLMIEKRGHLRPEFDTATRTRFWQVNWVVSYANIGGAAATNVALQDTLGSGQTLQSVRALPPISPTISGNVVSANLGDVRAGRNGTLILKTVLPYNTSPGTVLENAATIAADNDSVTINNSAVATVTVPLLPPLVTSPVPGTTCTGTLTVTGHAQAGVSVDIYINGAAAATATADANGDWSTSLTLPDGTYDLHAVAVEGALTSAPSPTVMVIVDSTLFWDPMSLRFEDENGRTVRPSGRLDESGWSVFLRADHTYTISLQICCEDPNVQVELELNGDIIPLSDPDGDGTFTATFTSSGRQVGSIRICVVCELIKRCSDGELTIDPEGTVFNLISGQPIDAANVACFQATVDAASTEQAYALWPAEDYQQINPQSVGTDGYFSFFTPPGTYQLNVNKDGYQPYRSWDLVVVDAPVHFDVPLTPILSQAADHGIDVTDDGFEPAVITVEPGSVIEWTNVGDGLHTTTSVTPTVSYGGSQAAGVNDSGAWDSGLLTPGSSYKRQLSTEGTYTYRDSENPAFTATIVVAKAAEQPTTNSTIFLPLVNR